MYDTGKLQQIEITVLIQQKIATHYSLVLASSYIFYFNTAVLIG